MPVAKSYMNLPIQGEVYYKNNKPYVQVVLKSGKPKEVRWYTQQEFNKMYPELAVAGGKSYGPQMKCLGFQDENDSITIFSGNVKKNEEWFMRCPETRFHTMWGWYVISGQTCSNPLPDGVYEKKLPWSSVGQDDGYLKPEAEVVKAVHKIIN